MRIAFAHKETLLDLWGDASGQIWVVGDNATVLHRVPPSK